MAQLSAVEIYRFAKLAGFSPDAAVTMTAIALAESRGCTDAHNPHGEDSRGLWQINVAAHRNLARTDLYDPLANARAAFAVSRGGTDVSAWTTTHRGRSAAYIAYRTEAIQAALRSGDLTAQGNFTGTAGYGHPLSAASGTGPASTPGTAVGAPVSAVGHGAVVADATGALSTGTPSADESHRLEAFLQAAKAQVGDRYIYGVSDQVSDPNPSAFDCAELVQWAAGRVGVEMPTASYLQYLRLKQQGRLISVEQAKHTPGALLFHFSSEPTPGGGRPSEAHVAISAGDGTTIEARGTAYGVGEWDAGDRFDYAAVIPGISDGGAVGAIGTSATDATQAGALTVPTPRAAVQPAVYATVDSDHDGISDAREHELALLPHDADTDHDGYSDGYEMTVSHTDPRSLDTDHDGVSDAFEYLDGTDPTLPDTDRDGVQDGPRTPASTADSDGDGLADQLERILGTDPTRLDSDRDGFDDFAEYRGRFDPTDPLSYPGAPSSAADAVAAAGAPPPPADLGLDDGAAPH